jgi:hypothetical protein
MSVGTPKERVEMNTRTTDIPFSNPTRDEKLRVLEELRRTNTRSAYTGVTSPVAGGRFAKVLGECTVGSQQVPNYPAANSPWSGPQVGLEPPFPEDIQYVEPCGTPEEIAKAAQLLSASSPSVGMTSPIPDSGAAAEFSIGSAVNSAGQSPATPPPPQPQDVAAATARRSFSMTRRFG